MIFSYKHQIIPLEEENAKLRKKIDDLYRQLHQMELRNSALRDYETFHKMIVEAFGDMSALGLKEFKIKTYACGSDVEMEMRK